jgi:hypothetical protein
MGSKSSLASFRTRKVSPSTPSSPASTAFTTRMASTIAARGRRVRSSSSPSAFRVHKPAPRAMRRRPPHASSRVAASMAITEGCRQNGLMAPTHSSMRDVSRASTAATLVADRPCRLSGTHTSE